MSMLPPGLTRAVLMAHGHRCHYCGKVATAADHIVPRYLGGSDSASNLIASCARCNARKGAKRLAPEQEREAQMQAFIVAGMVQDMAARYRAAAARALALSRASFIKQALAKAVNEE